MALKQCYPQDYLTLFADLKIGKLYKAVHIAKQNYDGTLCFKTKNLNVSVPYGEVSAIAVLDLTSTTFLVVDRGVATDAWTKKDEVYFQILIEDKYWFLARQRVYDIMFSERTS